MSNIDISFIIINYNTIKITIKCVEHIRKSKINYNYEIIIVDNNSSDGSFDLLNKLYNDIVLIKNEKNYGFGKANNIGAKKSKGKYLFLINSDAFVKENAINILINILETNNNIDVVAPKLLNTDGTIQKSALANNSFIMQIIYLTYMDKLYKYLLTDYFRDRFDYYYYYRQYPISVIGACFVVRRKIFIDHGGFDENFFFCFEEFDFFKRIHNWHNIALIPEAEVIHLGGGSTKSMADFALYNCLLGSIKYSLKWNGSIHGLFILLCSIYHYFIKYLFFSKKSLNSLLTLIQKINKLSRECLFKYNARHEILGPMRKDLENQSD